MNFHPDWFGGSLLWMAAALCLPVLTYAAAGLRGVGQMRLLAAAAVLVLPQLLQAQVSVGQLAGVAYHLLGVNLACLMLGGRAAAAWAAVWLAVLAAARFGADAAAVWPLNVLCTVLPACAVNIVVRRWGRKRLPPNVFVYIFVYGFLAAAAGMLLTGAAVAAVLQAAGVAQAAAVFPVFLLLAWGEAFLSGLLAAVGVAFLPQLLATFDDGVYLRREKRIWKD